MGNETSIDSIDPNEDIKKIRKARSNLENKPEIIKFDKTDIVASTYDDINLKLSNLDKTLTSIDNVRIDNYDDSSSAFVRAPARIRKPSKSKTLSNPVSAASSPIKQEDNMEIIIKKDASSAFSSPNFKTNSIRVTDSKSFSKISLLSSFEDDTSVNKKIIKSKLNSGIHNLTSVIARDLTSEFKEMRELSEVDKVEKSLRAYWIKDKLINNFYMKSPNPPEISSEFTEFLFSNKSKGVDESVSNCPHCKKYNIVYKSLCDICNRTVCSECNSNHLYLDDIFVLPIIITYFEESHLISNSPSVYVSICHTCKILINKWQFIAISNRLKNCAPTLFLNQQMQIFRDIDSCLPQMTGILMTLECLKRQSADDDDAFDLLFKDFSVVKVDIEKSFNLLKIGIQKANEAENYPDELFIIKKICMIFKAYSKTYLQDKWPEYKKLLQKLQDLDKI